jgi:hypothetical protein
MKKLLTSIALFATAVSLHAASYTETSLLGGWNVYATNGTPIVPGATNTLFTTYNGQVVYSLTNNVINGTLDTNAAAPDALSSAARLLSDANGDFVANTALHWYINNTNLIPVAVTNSQGQYFVYIGNTNGLPTAQTYPAVGWPLVGNQYPTYMFPASTNLYPVPSLAVGTNSIIFYLQRGWTYPLGSSSYTVWDTSTNIFSFTVNLTGDIATSGVTNLPTTFTQGATKVRVAAITVSTNSVLINALSLGQPVP